MLPSCECGATMMPCGYCETPVCPMYACPCIAWHVAWDGMTAAERQEYCQNAYMTDEVR